MYYLLVENLAVRTRLLEYLREKGIMAVFHYVPLHSSPAGMRYSRCGGSLRTTEKISDQIIRLPLYFELKEARTIIESVCGFYNL
jgi:dTDP-4-amino-4,6-dideoxygalactose transaminase